MPWTNEEIAQVFEDLASLLELKGELIFKVRAYQRAARSIEMFPEPIELLVRRGEAERLREVPGIGDAIARKIEELVTTGRLRALEEAKEGLPPGVLNLMRIPGIGPKTALRLAQELGISTVEELEQALEDGRVARLPRMGPKTAENLLRAIRAMRSKDARIPLGKALPVAEEVVQGLRERVLDLEEALPVGSLRRWRDTVGDIDIMCVAPDWEGVIRAFVSLPLVTQVLMQGPKKASVVTAYGLQVDLRLVEREAFGAMLQYFTGSKQHNILLREYAHRLGLSLSEYGITDLATGRLERFATEEAFYARLGLQPPPPEIREGTREVDLARQGALPRLVEVGDIRGDLHTHSQWSDGRDDPEAMVASAKARGYEYIALTDHSAGLGVARGLTPERLREQRKVLRDLEARYGIRVLQGSEVEVRADGSLDFPDEVLAELDIVVIAVHSARQQNRERMTARILRALDNPYVRVLAHPTGRLLGEREPIDVDLEAVFRKARERDIALEINASPDRLDLKDTHIQRARELGVPLVISTDAHSADALAQIRFGVAQARRGWCEPRHILNTRPLAEFLQWLKREG